MGIKEIMTTSSKVERKDTEEYYNKLKNKYAILKKFLLVKRNKKLISDEKDDLKDMFLQLNEFIFAGFDYFYVNDFNKLFNSEKSKNMKPYFILLVNRNHIDKLRKTVDCLDNLEFINYKNCNYIWYKNTNVRANIILFERNENNDLVINRGNNQMIINNEVIQAIDNEKNKEYHNLEYKLIR